MFKIILMYNIIKKGGLLLGVTLVEIFMSCVLFIIGCVLLKVIKQRTGRLNAYTFYLGCLCVCVFLLGVFIFLVPQDSKIFDFTKPITGVLIGLSLLSISIKNKVD